MGWGREPEAPLQEVATPGIKTIAALAEFLNVPESKTLKAVFYMADGEPVFVTIRGDLEVNEVKLKNALHCDDLRFAEDAEVQAAGLVAGSASAVGITSIRKIADPSIESGNNFVVGANKPDTHMTGANYPRDFQVDILTDIALAQPGQQCARCGGELQATRGVEVGHIFKLGTFFSETLGANYLDAEGRNRPITMGCYGIGVGRLLAAAIEQNHDDRGIVFPRPIAPYQAHLVGLNLANEAVAAGRRRPLRPAERQGHRNPLRRPPRRGGRRKVQRRRPDGPARPPGGQPAQPEQRRGGDSRPHGGGSGDSAAGRRGGRGAGALGSGVTN